jgi:type I restriction enzyme, S subunit
VAQQQLASSQMISVSDIVGDTLPVGWITAPLASLISDTIGGDWGTDPSEKNGHDGVIASVIRGTEFRNWDRDHGKSAARRFILNSKLAKRQLREGNIVLEVSGGGPHQPVGRTLLIDKTALSLSSLPLICSNFCRRLRVSEGIMPVYLAWLLKFLHANGAFDRFQTQTTNLRNLNVTDLLNGVPIPLAPLSEQMRIVAKVEEVLSHVNAARERLAKLPTMLKRFRQSVLAAACSGRLTADWRDQNGVGIDEWRHNIRLADICESITDGDHLPPPKAATGVPFLTIGNVSDGRLDFSETRFVGRDYYEKLKPARIPRLGDVLYTVVGATIGIPVLVECDRPFVFQRHIAILKPAKDTLPKFLLHLMNNRDVFNDAWSRTTGSAQPTLPLGGLRIIPVSLPTLAEQHEIVRRVEALFALANKIEARITAAIARANRLVQATLAKAYRGKLVPTEAEIAEQEGRDYETAERLLGRIQSAAGVAAQ